MIKRNLPGILLLLALWLSTSCSLFAPSRHPTADYTPVFASASAGNLESVRAAVMKDPDVLNAREWDNATLLHLAVGQNHMELAAFLLAEGADVNAKTTDGITPLHMAAQNGNLEDIQLLLDHRANINAIDSKGWTPMDRALKWRHSDAANFLKSRGGHPG
jgi:ankyrin repeat protein